MEKREMYIQLKKNKSDPSMLEVITNHNSRVVKIVETLVHVDFVEGLGQKAVDALEDKGYVNITITMSSLQ